MKKYYEIESVENEIIAKDNAIITEETDTIVKKTYYIYIEGMQYGSMTRKTDNYSEALKLYREMKTKFNIFKCNVVLDKHVEYTDGVIDITTVYKKAIGQKYDLQSRFKEILEIANEIDKMKRMYIATSTDADKYVSAFTHTIEEMNTEEISDSQMREMFRGVEEKSALRRISKVQIDYIQNIGQNISSIRSNANKCLETCKKLEYLNNTDKAKQNSKAKSEEYKKILGLA